MTHNQDSSYENNSDQRNFLEIFHDLPNGVKLSLQFHWMAYLVVNAMLFFINIMTGYSYPWHLFPLAGWGIGLSIHTAVMVILIRYKDGITRGFAIHAALSFIVIGFLLFLNSWSHLNYLWFLWPTSAILLVLSEHFVAYKRLITLRKGYYVSAYHALAYPGFLCGYLVFIDIFSGGGIDWCLWAIIPIMLLSYFIIDTITEDNEDPSTTLNVAIKKSSHNSNPNYIPNRKSNRNLINSRFCPQCGEKISRDHEFCEYCGLQFSS